MAKAKVETAKDKRQYVEVDSVDIATLNSLGLKLYVLSSADSHYYQFDVSAVPAVVLTDRGTTAPTDGLIVIGG